VEFWLSRSLFPNHNGILDIKEPFHTIKFAKCTNWGKSPFIYITKSIYTGFASLKTLPPDLEPPLQGKKYNPPYCNENAEKKTIVFSEITYRFMIWFLIF
jgi:hypothetical protein